MEETRRCPEQSFINHSRNYTGCLPDVCRILLQKGKELRTNNSRRPRFQGPIRQYNRGTQFQAKTSLGSIISVPVAVSQTLVGVYSDFLKGQTRAVYFLCDGPGPPYDCVDWGCGAHD